MQWFISICPQLGPLYRLSAQHHSVVIKQSRRPRVQRITASLHGLGGFNFYRSKTVPAEFINTSMSSKHNICIHNTLPKGALYSASISDVLSTMNKIIFFLTVFISWRLGLNFWQVFLIVPLPLVKDGLILKDPKEMMMKSKEEMRLSESKRDWAWLFFPNFYCYLTASLTA